MEAESKGGYNMKIPNRILELSTDEYRLMIYGLIQWRNKLLAQGRYPDAVDELLIKLQKRKRR